MATLIKFTITDGLGCFVGALLIAFVALYIFYCNKQKKEVRKYEKEYDQLKFFVDYGEIDAITKKSIREKFEEISRFNCCNVEKLQVLKRQFNNKFKDIK